MIKRFANTRTIDRLDYGWESDEQAEPLPSLYTFTGRKRSHNASSSMVLLRCTHCGQKEPRDEGQLKNLRRRPLCFCGGVLAPVASTDAQLRH